MNMNRQVFLTSGKNGRRRFACENEHLHSRVADVEKVLDMWPRCEEESLRRNRFFEGQRGSGCDWYLDDDNCGWRQLLW